MSTVRSGLLAAWGSAWLAGRVSYDDAVDAVTGADEPHRVVGLAAPHLAGSDGIADEPAEGPGDGPVGAPAEDPGVPLGWLLTALRDRGSTAVRLVLPVPGDPRGLPGPGPFTSAAVTANEAVLVPGLGAVPALTRHGSAVGSAATSVRWTAYRVGEPTPDPLSVAEAEHDLAAALREATAALVEVDAASWSPGGAPDADLVRRHAEPRLPPGWPARAVRLLVQADRLAGVLSLADADAPGGAVTGAQARARDEALRPLRTAVRRARLAAYNDGP
ncbi:MAG TPA: hypothetical protein VFX70_08680 [Mycobacteriales bacterium]|nr:hypothetical protein [Mycobacteriales bacterium]